MLRGIAVRRVEGGRRRLAEEPRAGMEAEQVRDLVAGAEGTRTHQHRDRLIVVGRRGADDGVVGEIPRGTHREVIRRIAAPRETDRGNGSRRTTGKARGRRGTCSRRSWCENRRSNPSFGIGSAGTKRRLGTDPRVSDPGAHVDVADLGALDDSPAHRIVAPQVIGHRHAGDRKLLCAVK